MGRRKPAPLRRTAGDRAPPSPFASGRLRPILPAPVRIADPPEELHRGLHLERVRNPNHHARRSRGDHRRRRPSPVSAPAPGIRGDLPDRRHRLVVAGAGPGPEPARNTLEGSNIQVKVGLREGSASMQQAEAVGFTRESGTLGEYVLGHRRVRPVAAAHLRRGVRGELPAHSSMPSGPARPSASRMASCFRTCRPTARTSRATSTSSRSARRGWGRRCAVSTSRAAR